MPLPSFINLVPMIGPETPSLDELDEPSWFHRDWIWYSWGYLHDGAGCFFHFQDIDEWAFNTFSLEHQYANVAYANDQTPLPTFPPHPHSPFSPVNGYWKFKILRGFLLGNIPKTISETRRSEFTTTTITTTTLRLFIHARVRQSIQTVIKPRIKLEITEKNKYLSGKKGIWRDVARSWIIHWQSWSAHNFYYTKISTKYHLSVAGISTWNCFWEY